MMIDRLRLAWRMQRWELAFLIGGSLGLAIAMVAVAWQLEMSRETLLACYEQVTTSASCRSTIEWGNLLMGAIGMLGVAATVAPFLIGLLLGAPLVAREIEHRTAPLAWSLAPSRREWLTWRVVPVVLVVGAALLILGQASEVMLRTAQEGDPGFRNFGMFGPILAARGLGVFALGVVAGLVAGRVLPAILVTAGLTIGLAMLITYGSSELQRAQAEWQVLRDGDWETVHMMWDSGFRSEATGEIMTYDEAYERYPDELNAMTDGSDAIEGWEQAARVLPAHRFDDFVLMESGVYGIVFVLAGLAALLVVRVRRPT